MKRISDAIRRLSIEHVWVLVIVVGIFAFLNTHPIMPNDYWWHMAVGREILATGKIPTVDTYSYSALGLPYSSYSQFWLMEVILYLVYNTGGLTLTILFQTAIVLPAYLLVLSLGYRWTHNWRAAAFGLLFAAALGFGNWNVRPQAVAYLLVAVVMVIIDRLRQKSSWKWLVLLTLVMVLWVNCHGSFPIGFVLLGVWFFEQSIVIIRMKMAHGTWSFSPIIVPGASLVVAAASTLANPVGLGFVKYLFTMANNSVVQNYIVEWMPPTFTTLDGSIFLIGLLILAVLFAISPKRPSFSAIMYFLIFGLLGLKYLRGAVWFGLILGPYAAEHMDALLCAYLNQPSRAVPTKNNLRLNIIITSVLGLLAVLSLPWFKQFLPLIPEKRTLVTPETPIAATQYIIEHNLPPQIFHGMGFGSYLLWKAEPTYKVFVDSRVELYPDAIWEDYLDISNANDGWEQKLAQYKVGTLMLEPKNQALLITAAKKSGHWQAVYADPYVILLVKK